MSNSLDAERQQIILESLALVERISVALNTSSYLWGGMACDVYEGHFLRDHHDLDYLTVNLHSRIEEVVGAFTQAGCDTEILINGDLKVEGTGINIHLGHVELGEPVRWIHDRNREQGTLCFPLEWLGPKPHFFEDVSAHVVEPELEYVIKSQPTLLNPSWIAREKDVDALARTQAILWGRGVHLRELFTKVGVETSMTNGIQDE